MKPVVKFTNVSKTYSLFKKKSDQLLDIFSFKKEKREFAALSNISFEVFKGETIGIIGVNGSGKSTLSNMLAQVIPPSTGRIKIEGETSLVAISAGLNNQLTGLENIELKCLMHGMSKDKIREITPDIIEFADIGEFINQPIKSYSSGMRSRLGFAISVNIDPDILVIDEALSVGDSTFYQKCLQKFDEFQEQGKTIFFISHSLSQVQNISDRIMWLNFGEIEKFDENEVVAKEYNQFIKWFNALTKQEKKTYRADMLNSQISKEDSQNAPSYQSREERYQLKRMGKKKNHRQAFQLSIVITIFLLSVLFMFVENPINALKNNMSNGDEPDSSIVGDDLEETDDHSHQENEQYPIEMNETGLISKSIGSVYADKDLENKLVDLPFGTQIDIEEMVGEYIYSVDTESGTGYIDSDIVELLEGDLPVADQTLADFLPLFPEVFANSYAFMFSFLNTDYEIVKASLGGLTEEYEDSFGQTVLVYEANRAAFKFNEENISSAIEIKEIAVEASLIDDIIRNSILVSEDEGLFLILLDDYKVHLDIQNKRLVFELIDSQSIN